MLTPEEQWEKAGDVAKAGAVNPQVKPLTLAEVKEWMQITEGKGGIGRRDLMEWLIAEVERLTDGIKDALAKPDARAYILEHTLKNGADNCCEGRCQGHGTVEEGQPIKPLEAYHAEMLRYQGRMVKTAKSFLELDAYKEAAECLAIAEGMKFAIGRIPKEPV